MAHKVRAEVSGGSVSSVSGAATQTRSLMRYLDLGTAHTCVVLDNSTAKCFGLGSSGQLGYGATTTLGDGAGEMGDALAAIDFGTDRTATMIATGASHSCALLDNSTVKCWGLGTNGRLGYGAVTSLGRTAGGDKYMQREIPGCEGQAHTTITNASHFLQEDADEAFADAINKFINANK